MSTELSKFNFEITSLQQAMDFAKLIADSDLAPKDYKGKPGNVLIAIQMGAEIGLKPLQALQNIAIINGRPCVWGDAMIGLVQNHPLCEYIHEELKNDTAYCIVKRRGDLEEHVSKFSRDDAKKAGLLSKTGTWQQYPDRMLQMRARGFALRDKFADVLKGIAMREEVEDYQILEESAKESRMNKGRTNIQQLLLNKSNHSTERKITFNEVKDMIDCAQSVEELIKITPIAQSLDEDEKKEIRRYYADALKDMKNNQVDTNNEETGEIITNSEYEKIRKQLLNAKSKDTLDIAADLINSIETEGLRHELLAIYNDRKVFFNQN